MNRLPVVLLVLVAACNGSSPTLAPTSTPVAQPPVTPSPPPSTVESVRDVTLGERVEGIFGDGRTIRPGEHHFFLTAPSTGTLEVSLQWDPDELGTLLMLKLEDRVFNPSRPNWSPVVGRLSVEAGKRYLIAVGLAGADWLPQDPFVVTTRLDQ